MEDIEKALSLKKWIIGVIIALMVIGIIAHLRQDVVGTQDLKNKTCLENLGKPISFKDLSFTKKGEPHPVHQGGYWVIAVVDQVNGVVVADRVHSIYGDFKESAENPSQIFVKDVPTNQTCYHCIIEVR